MKIITLASLVVLAGCQKVDPAYCPMHPEDQRCKGVFDGGVDSGPIGAHIGGTVNGLKGAGLVLQDNASDDYTIFGDGTGNPVMFTFPTVLPFGSAYAVTVSQQPANPLQACTVQKGSGTASNDVTDIDVTCATPSFAIGGNIVGLTNSGLSLHNANTGEDLPVVAGASSFAFTMKEPSGSSYVISIGAQPSGQNCSIFGGQGTVGTGDVTSVVVNCAANVYVVYGSINGLQGTTVLKDTNTNPTDSDTVTLNANSDFAFTKTIATGETYAVSVMTNPTYDAMTGALSQTCTPSNSTGTAPSVNPVSVSCTTNTYTIGGAVSGLTSGSVVLHEATGNDDVTVNGNTNFTFGTRVASGSTYTVTVKTQPGNNQKCAVTSNGSGTVTSNNISNVTVQCVYQDPGVYCGAAGNCDPTASQECCDPEGSPSCTSTAAGSCAKLEMPCDDDADCGGTFHCCAMENPPHTAVQSIACQMPACADADLCDHMAPTNPCGAGKSCKPYGLLSGYYSCQ